MFAILSSVGALLSGMGLLMLAVGLLGTLLGVRMAEAGFSATITGLVMAAYFAGLVLGSLRGHKVILAVGHIRAFAAFASALSAATLAHVFDVDAWTWGALRLIEGFCMAGLYMCVESWLNERATNTTRGQILSFYMITTSVGMGLGQLLLNLPDPTGIGLFVVASILASLALVPVALTRMPGPVLPDVHAFGFRHLLRASPLGVLICCVSGTATGAFYGLGPLFAQRAGYGASDTALFMAATILGGMALMWPIGRLSDRFDRRHVILSLGIALTALALPVPMVMDFGLWPVLGLSAAAGGCMFTLYPMGVASANDHLEPHELVQAAAGLLLSYGVGAATGPLLAAPLMETAAGPGGLFMFLALGGLIVVVVTIWRMTMRPAVPLDEQAPFQAVARTTPVATELDPRGEGEQLSLDL